METLFSREMLTNCVAPVNEVAKAKLHGKRIISKSIDGEITAYLWNDKIYVTAISIIPETCKHRHRVFGGFSGSLWQCSDCGAKG